MMKIFRSKLGLPFAESLTNKPAEEIGDDLVVFFTKEEITWMKNNLNAEEFKVAWLSKQEDFNYTPLPEKVKEVAEWIKGIRKAMGVE